MKALHKAALIGVALALYSTAASAQLTNQGMLDQVVTEFATRATSWQTVVMNAAMFLFWTLGTISLVFTFGFMALRKADIGEFFAEFIRFILFFGFFLWLLRNGPAFANSIIQSLARIGEQASGVASVTPSGIVDIGFMILKQAFTNSSIWSPVDSFIGVALSVGILILLAVVAVNMLLLLVSGWLLMYAGIFFLGFGGSRWTSDMAINYYKTVLGVAVQIMTMVLLVGIGNDLLSSFYARMNTGTLNFEELGVMLVFCVALLMLVNRVPPLVAGIITGSGIGGAGGIGNFGAGAAIGAAMGAASMAAGAASVAGAAVMGGAASAAGGMSAIKAAFEKAGSSAGGGRAECPCSAAAPTPAAMQARLGKLLALVAGQAQVRAPLHHLHRPPVSAAARAAVPADRVAAMGSSPVNRVEVPARREATKPAARKPSKAASRPRQAVPAPACWPRPHRRLARRAASRPTPART